MTLLVNDEKIDITLENEKTVGQVLKEMEEELQKHDATTIGIKANDKRYPAEEFETLQNLPIEDGTKLELTVISKKDIVSSFFSAKEKFLSLSKKLLDIPSSLQSGKDKEANEIIEELADAIEDFCHTSALSALFPDVYNALKIDGKSITDFFEEFSPIVADFESSLKNKDTVTSGDLCEYEISPRLETIAKSIEDCLK